VTPITGGLASAPVRRTIRSVNRRLQRVVVTAACGAALLAGCRKTPPGPDVPALIEDLKSPDEVKRGEANLKIITAGQPFVPSLIQMLQDPNPVYRATAASTLYGMGARGKDAVPALAALLADPDKELRIAAAMALENMGPDAAPAVPQLTQALKDKEGRVRQRAAIALGNIGAAARPAVPALGEAAKWDPVRPAAEEAIRKIQARQ
jgi:HEAT repeat protein